MATDCFYCCLPDCFQLITYNARLTHYKFVNQTYTHSNDFLNVFLLPLLSKIPGNDFVVKSNFVELNTNRNMELSLVMNNNNSTIGQHQNSNNMITSAFIMINRYKYRALFGYPIIVLSIFYAHMRKKKSIDT